VPVPGVAQPPGYPRSVQLEDVLAHAGPDSPGVSLSGARFLTAWTLEPLPLAGILLAGGLYLLGVRRMSAAGNPWPMVRTVMFLGPGLGSMVVATQSAMATYDTVLLSVHMVQHMVLAMIAPIFLALGAPVTLALRTFPPRWRARLLALIHSRVAAVLTFPAVAGVLFVVNPFALYFSGLYEQTLRNPWLHDLMHVHFVVVGSLWFWSLLGVDPLPRRLSYPLRVLAAFATLPFHAFMGVAIMSANTLIAADWYNGQNREWGASPLEDQRLAGGILWSSGDLIGLIVFGVLFLQWIRASEREAKREDRRLDRLDSQRARAAAAAPASPGVPQPAPPAPLPAPVASAPGREPPSPAQAPMHDRPEERP
jgi:cytochrome c oxidase assembly factor CtaG